MLFFAQFLPSRFRWMTAMIIMMITIQVLLVLVVNPLIFVHECQAEMVNLTCTGSNQYGSLEDGRLYINLKLYPLAI